ncbi:DUF305 domain-containing protein [Zymobacter sp. IVIA_12111.31 C1]|uniref:CopM family metallochaperone n=1 Tax=Zymobacter sp. IVIA_12111.31 C1 TaxID=3394854 RepID=UPI0039C2794B
MRSLHHALVLGSVLLGIGTGTAAMAESMPMHDHARTSTAVQAQRAPSTKALKEAGMSMHKAMDITYTGNADVDFARAMIAHHQGAIDMAKVELQYGTAPEMRALAKDIVDSQQHQVEQMQRWIKDQEQQHKQP